MFVFRLSRGHVPSVPSSVPSVAWTFCPLNVNFHINRPKRPGCPWHVPNLSPGHSRGIPTTKFLYVIFLYRFFVLHKQEHKSKLLSPDIFRWGGGLPREEVGPKSSVCPSKAGTSNFLGGMSRNFAGISRGVPEKFE